MRNSAQHDVIRVGISSCLLGNEVRYDGGHKRDAFLVETFGACVEWVSVCPEVEAGLGVPREAMQLVRHPDGVRLLTIRSRMDHTDRLREWTRACLEMLARYDLCGYVLKGNSPSCGMERVNIYAPSGMPAEQGRGVFAAALMQAFPHLPVEDEGRLSDPHIRENFVERVFAYRRLRSL